MLRPTPRRSTHAHPDFTAALPIPGSCLATNPPLEREIVGIHAVPALLHPRRLAADAGALQTAKGERAPCDRHEFGLVQPDIGSVVVDARRMQYKPPGPFAPRCRHWRGPRARIASLRAVACLQESARRIDASVQPGNTLHRFGSGIRMLLAFQPDLEVSTGQFAQVTKTGLACRVISARPQHCKRRAGLVHVASSRLAGTAPSAIGGGDCLWPPKPALDGRGEACLGGDPVGAGQFGRFFQATV